MPAARAPQNAGPAAKQQAGDLGISFLNVARQSGLNRKTIFGGEHHNKYLLETTGCGVAFYDYDHDGWLDIFLVNGTDWPGRPAKHSTAKLYHNNQDGTFTDVTHKAGLDVEIFGMGVRCSSAATWRSKKALVLEAGSFGSER